MIIKIAAKEQGYLLLETLVYISLSSLLLVLFLDSTSSYIKSSLIIQETLKSTQDVRRLKNLLSSVCQKSRRLYGVSLINIAQNSLLSTSGKPITLNHTIKTNSSSLAVTLAKPLSILSRSTPNSRNYCSSSPPESKLDYFIGISPSGPRIFQLRENKTKCLFVEGCFCLTTFKDINPTQLVHTLLPISEHFAIFLDSKEILRWHSLENLRTQPIAYHIQQFQIRELETQSERVLEFLLRKKGANTQRFKCSLGPKDYHVLDSIF